MQNNIAQWLKIRFRFGSDERAPVGTDRCKDIRSRLKPTEEPIPVRSDCNLSTSVFGLRVGDVLHCILSCSHHDFLTTLSPTSQAAVLLAARVATDAIESCRERTTPLGSHVKNRAALLQRAHRTAVAELLKSNERLEAQVRALAWALDVDKKTSGVPVRLIADDQAEGTLGEDLVADATRRCSAHRRVIFWISDKHLPPTLVEAARRRLALVVADAESCAAAPIPSALLLDVNPAWVLRPRADGTAGGIRITGVAGLAQAALGSAPRSAWKKIQPPTGFSRLSYDIRASELAELLRSGFVGAIPSGGVDGEIVAPAGILPKSGCIHR